MENNIIRVYKNVNLTSYEDLKLDWSRKQNKYFSKAHSVSTYLAMFSPALPSFFIKKYTSEKDTIMDNFSGRGTTALVSRELNRNFVGSDLNPYAYVLSRFKISTINLNEIINRIDELEILFMKTKIRIYKKKYNELKYFYHENVLKQLIFLKEIIGRNWLFINEIDNAILAVSLGLMHGRMRKNGTTSYFSLDMPNTISMSPNYVKNYSLKNNLKKPNLNIFKKIKERLLEKYDENVFKKKYLGKMYYFDAIKKNNKVKDNSIDLVVTSPPYLSVVNYTASNWLKLWLLGYERKLLKNEIKLSDNLTFEKYVLFIEKYLNSIYAKLKKNAKVCLVVGDVHTKKLIEDVWKEISHKVSYKFVEIYYDKYKQNNKVTNMLNNKKGKATIIEKVLVIKKIGEKNECQ